MAVKRGQDLLPNRARITWAYWTQMGKERRYRFQEGIIREVFEDTDTARVYLPQINAEVTIPVEYSDCNAAAFSIGDRVIVFADQCDYTKMAVIGGVPTPRCGGVFFVLYGVAGTAVSPGGVTRVSSHFLTPEVQQKILNGDTITVGDFAYLNNPVLVGPTEGDAKLFPLNLCRSNLSGASIKDIAKLDPLKYEHFITNVSAVSLGVSPTEYSIPLRQFGSFEVTHFSGNGTWPFDISGPFYVNKTYDFIHVEEFTAYPPDVASKIFKVRGVGLISSPNAVGPLGKFLCWSPRSKSLYGYFYPKGSEPTTPVVTRLDLSKDPEESKTVYEFLGETEKLSSGGSGYITTNFVDNQPHTGLQFPLPPGFFWNHEPQGAIGGGFGGASYDNGTGIIRDQTNSVTKQAASTTRAVCGVAVASDDTDYLVVLEESLELDGLILYVFLPPDEGQVDDQSPGAPSGSQASVSGNAWPGVTIKVVRDELSPIQSSQGYSKIVHKRKLSVINGKTGSVRSIEVDGEFIPEEATVRKRESTDWFRAAYIDSYTVPAFPSEPLTGFGALRNRMVYSGRELFVGKIEQRLVTTPKSLFGGFGDIPEGKPYIAERELLVALPLKFVGEPDEEPPLSGMRHLLVGKYRASPNDLDNYGSLLPICCSRDGKKLVFAAKGVFAIGGDQAGGNTFAGVYSINPTTLKDLTFLDSAGLGADATFAETFPLATGKEVVGFSAPSGTIGKGAWWFTKSDSKTWFESNSSEIIDFDENGEPVERDSTFLDLLREKNAGDPRMAGDSGFGSPPIPDEGFTSHGHFFLQVESSQAGALVEVLEISAPQRSVTGHKVNTRIKIRNIGSATVEITTVQVSWSDSTVTGADGDSSSFFTAQVPLGDLAVVLSPKAEVELAVPFLIADLTHAVVHVLQASVTGEDLDSPTSAEVKGVGTTRPGVTEVMCQTQLAVNEVTVPPTRVSTGGALVVEINGFVTVSEGPAFGQTFLVAFVVESSLPIEGLLAEERLDTAVMVEVRPKLYLAGNDQASSFSIVNDSGFTTMLIPDDRTPENPDAPERSLVFQVTPGVFSPPGGYVVEGYVVWHNESDPDQILDEAESDEGTEMLLQSPARVGFSSSLVMTPFHVRRKQRGEAVFSLGNVGQARAQLPTVQLLFRQGGVDKTLDFLIVVSEGPSHLDGNQTGTFKITYEPTIIAGSGAYEVLFDIVYEDENSSFQYHIQSPFSAEVFRVYNLAELHCASAFRGPVTFPSRTGETFSATVSLSNISAENVNFPMTPARVETATWSFTFTVIEGGVPVVTDLSNFFTPVLPNPNIAIPPSGTGPFIVEDRQQLKDLETEMKVADDFPVEYMDLLIVMRPVVTFRDVDTDTLLPAEVNIGVQTQVVVVRQNVGITSVSRPTGSDPVRPDEEHTLRALLKNLNAMPGGTPTAIVTELDWTFTRQITIGSVTTTVDVSQFFSVVAPPGMPMTLPGGADNVAADYTVKPKEDFPELYMGGPVKVVPSGLWKVQGQETVRIATVEPAAKLLTMTVVLSNVRINSVAPSDATQYVARGSQIRVSLVLANQNPLGPTPGATVTSVLWKVYQLTGSGGLGTVLSTYFTTTPVGSLPTFGGPNSGVLLETDLQANATFPNSSISRVLQLVPEVKFTVDGDPTEYKASLKEAARLNPIRIVVTYAPGSTSEPVTITDVE